MLYDLELQEKNGEFVMSEEQKEEIEKIEGESFIHWKKNEFETFVSQVLKHGKEEMERIAAKLPNKTLEEVESYCKVFYERMDELSNASTIREQIRKKEDYDQFTSNCYAIIKQWCDDYDQRRSQYLNEEVYPGMTQKLYYEFFKIILEIGIDDQDTLRSKFISHMDVRMHHSLKAMKAAEIQNMFLSQIRFLYKMD